MGAIIVEMKQRKETPNKVVFEAIDGTSPVETQYIKKVAFGDKVPEVITVKVEWEE